MWIFNLAESLCGDMLSKSYVNVWINNRFYCTWQ